jgi:hypothetical protein
MKLFEIKVAEPKGHFVSPKDILGYGIQGKAYNHPKQPNSVIKTAKIEDPENDAYVEFIKLAMKNQDNPFFPRIHSAKIIKAGSLTTYKPAGAAPYKLVINMEKLQPYLYSNVTDAAQGMFQRLGVPEKVAQSTEAGALFNYLTNARNRNMLAAATKNSQFRRALDLLEPHIRKFGHDLHAGNWMIRLTGHGPQIVILDPFMPFSENN